MDIEALKAEWVGPDFDEQKFDLSAEQLRDFAVACGEEEPRFTDPNDPDFQAAPTFVKTLRSARALPSGFPNLGRPFDAGKKVILHAPIRGGDQLIGLSRISDIYSKTGRGGPMIFVVHEMEFRNQRDELVAVVDSRQINQPEAK